MHGTTHRLKILSGSAAAEESRLEAAVAEMADEINIDE